MNYVPVAAGTITNESADASYFDSLSKDVGNDEHKFVADDIRQVEDGPHNESDEKDKSEDDSSPKEDNVVGQHINTASPEFNIGRFEFNIVDPLVNIASLYDPHSLKDMLKVGASHTLEATLVEFFSDEDEPNQLFRQKEYLPNGKKAIGTKWVFRNKKMTKPNVIRNKARLVAQGHKEDKGIDYEEVFAPMERIKAIRLFLAYDSFISFLVYADDIIFGSTNKELLQQKEDGIFIRQDKYVAEILKKFNYTDVKSASTPVDLEKPLVKDGDVDNVVGQISCLYLTASRPDIMFVVCACARFQVTPKTSHLLAVKRIFRYLKGKPTLGL
ncbi:uncharacterized mitochondrial protein-like protein, partial [Tanacetum coccineum]